MSKIKWSNEILGSFSEEEIEELKLLEEYGFDIKDYECVKKLCK